MNKQLKYTGINRAIPQQEATDGSCQEIINLRPRKGAWRPIGAKTKLYDAVYRSAENGSQLIFDRIFIHDIEDGIVIGQPNYIGYRKTGGDALYLINQVTGICSLIETIQNPSAIPFIVFLKRTMIVTSESGLLIYLYSNDGYPKYGKIGNLPTPDVNLFSQNDINPTPSVPIKATVTTEFAHDQLAVLGEFYNSVNQQSHLFGRLYGSILYIAAFRLFDGTIVMPSTPKYLECGNGGVLHQNNPDGSGWDNARWQMIIALGSVAGKIATTGYTAVAYDSIKDLIDSVVVFSTKATPLYKIDETTVITSMLQSEAPYPGNVAGSKQDDVDRSFASNFPLNSPDFENLVASQGWYKILEFPFSKIVGETTGSIVKMADTKNFYQDYATRLTLATDQFSHHSLVAKSLYVYNDRVHALNIKTKLAVPSITWPELEGFTRYFNIEGVITAYLSTSQGKAVLVNESLVPSYVRASDGKLFLCWPGIVSYPDARATKLEVAVQDDNGNYREVFSVDLKKNDALNFSYYHRIDFSITPPASDYNYNHRMIEIENLGAAYTIPAARALSYDPNRLQVSEIQNPLVYPAKNSYQIGTGEGIAIASGSEPLSAGQFGAFPLQVFTSKGIWALELGSNDVLYSNILPVNGEVVDNPKNIISVGSGVVYSTLRGLYLLEGMQVTQFSQNIEGDPHGFLNATAEIQKLITDNLFTPSLEKALSAIDFLEYMQGSSIGFDKFKDNKELLVTNHSYNYSYVFSFESKIWFKVSGSYSMLINSYPKLLGIQDGKILDISDDENEGLTDVMIITNALFLEMPDQFKKIERMIARAIVTTSVGSWAGFYLFATDDLVTYRFITGRQRSGERLKDFLLQRSHGSAKYYVLVFNAKMSHESSIESVDISLISKLNLKLR